MRAIDADALIEEFESVAKSVEDPVMGMIIEAAIRDIKRAPTLEHFREVTKNDVPDKNVGNSSKTPNSQDLISRQAAKEAHCKHFCHRGVACPDNLCKEVNEAFDELPTIAQPEPLSDVYTKAVWTWLINYQIKAADLKGRYTPYEVLSWVVNDWRKEHERSDK